MQEYLMVRYIAIILESRIRRRICAYGLSKRMRPHGIYMELNKLWIVKQ